MSSRVRRSFFAVVALVAWCTPAAGDEFECGELEGCDALNTATGNVIKFRKGDVVSTERGFVVSGESGWELLD